MNAFVLQLNSFFNLGSFSTDTYTKCLTISCLTAHVGSRMKRKLIKTIRSAARSVPYIQRQNQVHNAKIFQEMLSWSIRYHLVKIGNHHYKVQLQHMAPRYPYNHVSLCNKKVFHGKKLRILQTQ